MEPTNQPFRKEHDLPLTSIKKHVPAVNLQGRSSGSYVLSSVQDAVTAGKAHWLTQLTTKAENTPLEKENHLNQTIIFRFQLLILRGLHFLFGFVESTSFDFLATFFHRAEPLQDASFEPNALRVPRPGRLIHIQLMASIPNKHWCYCWFSWERTWYF